MHRQSEGGADREDAGEEHGALEGALGRERVAEEQQPTDEEGESDDKGNDVHEAILGTIRIVTPVIVVAPDSFKGSLTARQVAGAMAQGWHRERPADQLVLTPQADGGEGTLDAVEASVAGAVRHSIHGVTGPDHRPVNADWLALPDGTAVVELASSSGLPLMTALDPMGATTRGVGEVIAAALDAGASRLVVGLGGSASTDGGRGALEALGWPTALRPPPAGGVTLLSDVTAPLLGPTGSAAIFAPQKGASPSQVAQLEARHADWAALLGADPMAVGSGAAGGTAYGLAHWGASIVSGADYLAELTGLSAALEQADLVLTGEGRFDSQSLGGKVVGRLLQVAGDRCVIIAGQVSSPPPCPSYSLAELSGDVASAVEQPAHWVREAAAQAARDLAPTFQADDAS